MKLNRALPLASLARDYATLPPELPPRIAQGNMPMITTPDAPRTLADMERDHEELGRQISMARAMEERRQRLTKARPEAAALLGRLLLDAEPRPSDAHRLRKAAKGARQADKDAWEVLADHYKFKLPRSLVAADATTPRRKRRIAEPADPVNALAASDVAALAEPVDAPAASDAAGLTEPVDTPAASDAAAPVNAPSSGELF